MEEAYQTERGKDGAETATQQPDVCLVVGGIGWGRATMQCHSGEVPTESLSLSCYFTNLGGVREGECGMKRESVSVTSESEEWKMKCEER